MIDIEKSADFPRFSKYLLRRAPKHGIIEAEYNRKGTVKTEMELASILSHVDHTNLKQTATW